MATLRLAWNDTNTAPASVDLLHYKQFTVPFADDRKVEQVVERSTLLNKNVSEDVIGIYRYLKFCLKTSDVKNNLEFLYSFFNSDYRWAMITDTGYYFNLGTYASPVLVPIIIPKSTVPIDVEEICKKGLEVKTRDICIRESALGLSDYALSNPGNDDIVITCTPTLLRMGVYFSFSPGGPYLFDGYSNSQSLTVEHGNGTFYFVITRVTIAGESPYSAEDSIVIAA